MSGSDFSTTKLKEMFPDLILSNSNEKPDIVSRGKLKGGEYGFGSTQVVVNKSIVYKFDWLLHFIVEHASQVKYLGVEDQIIMDLLIRNSRKYRNGQKHKNEARSDRIKYGNELHLYSSSRQLSRTNKIDNHRISFMHRKTLQIMNYFQNMKHKYIHRLCS